MKYPRFQSHSLAGVGVIALLGQMSAYLLPAALLLLGVILYLVSTR